MSQWANTHNSGILEPNPWNCFFLCDVSKYLLWKIGWFDQWQYPSLLLGRERMFYVCTRRPVSTVRWFLPPFPLLVQPSCLTHLRENRASRSPLFDLKHLQKLIERVCRDAKNYSLSVWTTVALQAFWSAPYSKFWSSEFFLSTYK